jgi:hypothetical protein
MIARRRLLLVGGLTLTAAVAAGCCGGVRFFFGLSVRLPGCLAAASLATEYDPHDYSSALQSYQSRAHLAGERGPARHYLEFG